MRILNIPEAKSEDISYLQKFQVWYNKDVDDTTNVTNCGSISPTNLNSVSFEQSTLLVTQPKYVRIHAVAVRHSQTKKNTQYSHECRTRNWLPSTLRKWTVSSWLNAYIHSCSNLCSLFTRFFSFALTSLRFWRLPLTTTPRWMSFPAIVDSVFFVIIVSVPLWASSSFHAVSTEHVLSY